MSLSAMKQLPSSGFSIFGTKPFTIALASLPITLILAYVPRFLFRMRVIQRLGEWDIVEPRYNILRFCELELKFIIPPPKKKQQNK